MKKFHFLDEFWPRRAAQQPGSHPNRRRPLSVHLPSRILFVSPPFLLSLSLSISPAPSLLLPLVLRSRVFLFAKARIATDDEGVLPFPRDLHKISIPVASRGKISTSHAGPDDESHLLKPARLALTYAEERHKGEIVIFTARPDFAVASRIPSLSPSRFIPLILSISLSRSCNLDPPANSRSPSCFPRLPASRNLFGTLLPAALSHPALRWSRNRSALIAISRDSPATENG